MWWVWIGVCGAAGARFVVVGDTGAPEVEEARCVVQGVAGCNGGERGREAEEIAGLIRSLRGRLARGKVGGQGGAVDAIIVTGDNFYGPGLFEAAPRCRPRGYSKPSRQERNFDAVVGRYVTFFGDLMPYAPVYAVLGNHDVGHGWMPGWRARRYCSEQAMTAVGWGPEGGIGVYDFPIQQTTGEGEAQGVRALPGGVVRLLDTNRALQSPDGEFENGEALSPRSLLWEVWVGHHAWSLTHEKGGQPAALRRRLSGWKVHPDGSRPTIWVNGHAHHQEATLKDGVLAITSGSGSKHRDLDPKRADPPDRTLYADNRRGYTVLDITGDSPETLTVTVTPRAFDDAIIATVTCRWEGEWVCSKSTLSPSSPSSIHSSPPLYPLLSPPLYPLLHPPPPPSPSPLRVLRSFVPWRSAPPCLDHPPAIPSPPSQEPFHDQEQEHHLAQRQRHHR